MAAIAPRPAATGSWRVAAASVAGPRHVEQGRTGDDAAAWFVRGNFLFIAVADGAGSAPHGKLGSAVAVSAALRAGVRLCLAQPSITPGAAWRIVETAVHHADERVRQKAASFGTAPADFATTLIAVFATPVFVAVCQVGDGAVVVSESAGEFIALTRPAKGEFSNETPMLGCNPTMELRVRSGGNPLRSIAVFTDGLERLALELPAGIPHRGFFRPLFQGLRTLPGAEANWAVEQLLRSSRVAARSDDDKTLITAQLECD